MKKNTQNTKIRLFSGTKHNRSDESRAFQMDRPNHKNSLKQSPEDGDGK